MDDMALWNLALTAAFGVVTFLAKSIWSEQQRISVLLNKTREEMAREFLSKRDAHQDTQRIFDRLDAMESKLDRLIEARK